MLLMSYAYYYFYYEKSPNDKPKGAHHTPGRGVVGTLRLVKQQNYFPISGGCSRMFTREPNTRNVVCLCTRFCEPSYKRNFHRLGFSLFSVDSGDQKIKTFCTFFGCREAAHLRQFILGQPTSPGKQLYLDTKNSYDNYEQLRTRSGRFGDQK